jgi:hypothetical protein
MCWVKFKEFLDQGKGLLCCVISVMETNVVFFLTDMQTVIFVMETNVVFLQICKQWQLPKGY